MAFANGITGLDAFLAEEIAVLKEEAGNDHDPATKLTLLDLAIAKIGAIRSTITGTRAGINSLISFLPLEDGLAEDTDLDAMSLDEIVDKVAEYLSVQITDEVKSEFRKKYSALFEYSALIKTPESKEPAEYQDFNALNLPDDERVLNPLAGVAERVGMVGTETRKRHEKMSNEQLLNDCVKALNIAGIRLDGDNHKVETVDLGRGSMRGYVIILPGYDLVIFCSAPMSSRIMTCKEYEELIASGLVDNLSESVTRIEKKENHMYRLAYEICERVKKDFNGVLTVHGQEVIDIYRHKKLGRICDLYYLMQTLKAQNIEIYKEFSDSCCPAIFHKKDVYKAIEDLFSLEKDESLETLEAVEETYRSDDCPEGERMISILTLRDILKSSVSRNIKDPFERRGVQPMKNKFHKTETNGGLSRVYNYKEAKKAIKEIFDVDIETTQIEMAEDGKFLFSINGEPFFCIDLYLEKIPGFNTRKRREMVESFRKEGALPHETVRIRSHFLRYVYPVNEETLRILEANGFGIDLLFDAATSTSDDHAAVQKIELA